MIGETVRHYTILEELGGGGMGVVYKAEDTKLKRSVALKFLPSELTRDKDAKARFTHEAQAASALQHHNICTIHEIDETQDGRLFIVMDCYEGETLKEIISKGPLSPEEAVNIVTQIAEGLSKAHGAGMVHRDIKPANILITTDKMVKILDFGLAKLAGQTRVTRTGSTLGTVAYMSPEQARGEDVDARSDIFSLGAVFYELLTGTVPFKGDHEATVLYGIMNSDPEKLSVYRNDLPDRFQLIIDHMLTKALKDRYENTSALLTDLTQLKPEHTRETGPSRRIASNQNRHRIVGIAAAALVAAVIALLLGRQYVFHSSTDELALAVIDFSTVADTDDPVLSAGITGLIQVGLVESSPIRVISPTYLQDLRRRLFGETHGPIAESQALEVARKSGATLVLTGQLGRLGDDQYVTWLLMDVEDGNSLAARRVEGVRATDLADRIVGEVVSVLIREAGVVASKVPTAVASMTTDSPEAYRHYVAGVLAIDEGSHEDAIRHLLQAVDLDSTFALAYYELSREHTRESGRGRMYADKAWAHRSKLGIKDRMRLDAWMAWIDYRVKDALALDRELLARWPEDRELLKYFGERLYANWYTKEALEVATEGLRFYPEDFQLGVIHQYSMANLGRTKEALTAGRIFAQRHPQNADTWDCLGERFRQCGVPDSADAMFDKALTIDADDFWATFHRSTSDYYRGNVKRAIEQVDQMLMKERIPLLMLRFLTDDLGEPSLAFLYAEMGQIRRALEIIEEAKRYTPDPEKEMRFIVAPRNNFLLRMGRADDVYEWSKMAEKRAEIPAARLRVLVERMRSLVELDSLDAARTAIEKFRSQENFWGGYSQTMAYKYIAKLALRESDPRAALDALNSMKHYGIPFGGIYDVEYREILADAYLLAGRLEEAAGVHEEMLRFYGGHALSHYELGKIYEEMGRTTDAKEEFTIFLDKWSEADEGLPQLEDARSRLAELPTNL